MKKQTMIAALGLLVASCASMGTVTTDFDPKADFQKYHTYAYLDKKDLGGSDLVDNTILQNRIETMIDQNMQTKGFAKVAPDQNPSMLVRYWVGIKDKQDIQYVDSAMYGPYSSGRWGPMYDQAVTVDYKEGTLILDFIDPATKDLVWRAYLQQVLENKQTNIERAEANLKKAFLAYPPNAQPEKQP